MKLETTNKKKYPCEQCAEGIYMSVEDMWWCDKYLEYACGMERNHLCEKFERDGEQTDGSRQALPSVTPVSKKLERAHWIDNHNGTISCSCCHAWFHKDDRYSYMRYCPNCGAKMEAEKNE